MIRKKQRALDELSSIRQPEQIIPRFSFTSADVSNKTLLSISNGVIKRDANVVLENLTFSLLAKERIAITGCNGSGKSTFVKAILQAPGIKTTGYWQVPLQKDIGYLDQHYSTLDSEKTVLETITTLVPSWSMKEVRQHLSNFLFRKNNEISLCIKQLSGGAKVRLSLACISAKTPRILILDEVENNLDMETKEHVRQTLKEYPGALIVISHNSVFLEEIGIHTIYKIKNNHLKQS